MFAINSVGRLIVMSIVVSVAAQAAGSVVIGGPSATLAPGSGGYSFDGNQWTGWKSAVSNVANFGPSGTVPTSVTTTVLNTITAGTLSGVNIFVSPWWTTSESSPYHSIIQTYFLGGGSLILLDDSSGRDGIASVLGIPTAGQNLVNWTASAPLLSPFAAPGTILTSGEIGFFTTANITSRGGTVCATNGTQPTAACFARGAYAAGAGAMIIVADIDTWTSMANYSPPDSNGRFALNGTAFVINGSGTITGTPPPTPSAAGAPTLSEWGIILLAILLVGFGCARVARRAPEQA